MTASTELLILWAQTPSNYDMLFARAIRPDWASMHLPVISQNGKHYLYTGYNVAQPNGHVVVCHSGCGLENRTHIVRGASVKIVCYGCSSACQIPKLHSTPATVLGARSLVKVEFPQPRAKVEWKYVDPTAQEEAIESRPGSPSSPSVDPMVVESIPVSTPSAEPLCLRDDEDDFAEVLDPMDVDEPPSTIAPPPSLSPSPSPASADPPVLKIVLPPISSVRPAPRPSRSLRSTSRGTRRSSAQLAVAPPIERSQSAPEVKACKIPTNLDDFPPLQLSTSRRKRPRDDY